MPDIVTCESCGKETYATIPRCPHCGAAMATFDAVAHWSRSRNIRFTVSAVAVHTNKAFHIFVLVAGSAGFGLFVRGQWDAFVADPAALLTKEVAVFALVIVWAAWRALQIGPAAVLDRRGLHLPTLLAAPIPWSAIRDTAVEERFVWFLWLKKNPAVEVMAHSNVTAWRQVLVVRFTSPQELRWTTRSWLPGPMTTSFRAHLEMRKDSLEVWPHSLPLDATGFADLIADRRRVWGV